MYPPGQFAAWNRAAGRGRTGTELAAQPPDSNAPDRGQQGGGDGGRDGSARPVPGRAAADRSLPGRGQADPGRPQSAWQSPGSGPAGSAGTRYYERDAGSDYEPGYSVLAVSDPAADVTSTQTWQAVDDGRATGTWTAPARPGSAPARPGSGPARPRTGMPGPGDAPSRPGGLPGRERPASGQPLPKRAALTPAALTPAGPAQSVPAAAAVTAGQGRRAAHGHGGAHTGPHAVQRPRRKRPASVKVAFCAALLLVIAAASALAFVVLHNQATRKQAALPKPGASTASPQPSPTLGIYGHIGSRVADPLPLTIAQLYPASFTMGSHTVTRTAGRKGGDCASAVVGSGIQAAIGTAGCSQVVRATYLASGLKMMGTIGVYNLRTGNAARRTARSAGAVNFVAQLRARYGPTSKIGKGTGIEEAAAKGHYLILIWAEFTDLRKPKTASQRSQLVQFMTQLLDKTANVSLANRMASGTP
jgi:hypothetical protein